MAKNGEKKIVSTAVNKELLKKRQLQIVHAAGELFSKQGYHKTSMRDIAKVSGINLSYLYNFISSKEEILYLYYMNLYEKWENIFVISDNYEDQNPVDQLKKIIRLFLKIIHTYNDETLTMYTESRHLRKDLFKIVLSKEAKMVKLLEKLIRRGIERGFFKTKDPFMTANVIQYIVTIGPLRGWNFRHRYSFNRFVDLITDFVLGSLGVGEE